jgi:hypothetical protein
MDSGLCEGKMRCFSTPQRQQTSIVRRNIWMGWNFTFCVERRVPQEFQSGRHTLSIRPSDQRSRIRFPRKHRVCDFFIIGIVSPHFSLVDVSQTVERGTHHDYPLTRYRQFFGQRDNDAAKVHPCFNEPIAGLRLWGTTPFRSTEIVRGGLNLLWKGKRHIFTFTVEREYQLDVGKFVVLGNLNGPVSTVAL